METLSEKYLGIPLVQGRVSKATVAPLIDKIRLRASSWSGKILSFKSRIVLGFLNDHDPRAVFLRAKFFTKDGLITNYNKNSSIRTELKAAIATAKTHSTWIIGSGKEIDFWRDCWGSDIALIDFWISTLQSGNFAKLGQIISHHAWSAPLEVVEFLGTHGIDLNNIILNVADQDIRVWKHDPHG
ncbi:hypothetical protein GIB67_038608 [Kingdonia uniflora]|uniref:Uncharacterized protein n=1 Tax=Kingdonia uniflora TaxID=39325 RepID=A0A7J7NPJ7_9MAGN|nr:hypothetical protein GIB67_038608 [Kingdonia uniflora]